MKIVFWNINNKKNMPKIQELVSTSAPDLLFLAECPEEFVSEIDLVFSEIQPPYILPDRRPRVRGFLTSAKCQVDLVKDIDDVGDDRLTFYLVQTDKILFLLGTVHLVDKLYHDQSEQQSQAERIMRDAIKPMESAWQETTSDIILIGDFNMNPFDPGMVLARAFNSVCSEDIAQKESRTVLKDNNTYFYNPSWKIYAGVGSHVHGSFYLPSFSGHKFHWNNLDQVLLRPSILEKYYHRFEVLHNILNFDLRKEKDRNAISDHYPIMLTIEEKKNE